MILPQEMEVYYVIPAIRRELAKALIKEGLKQNKIAKIFGVSDACVSNYFKAKRAQDVKFNKELKKTIKDCASDLKKGKACYISIVQKICKEFKQSNCLCDLHKKLDNHVCGCKGCLA